MPGGLVVLLHPTADGRAWLFAAPPSEGSSSGLVRVSVFECHPQGRGELVRSDVYRQWVEEAPEGAVIEEA